MTIDNEDHQVLRFWYTQTMSALIYAFLAYLGWGIGDIFGAIYSRKVGGYASTFWSYLLRSVLFLLYIPFVLPNLKHLTVANTSLTVILSIIFIIGVSLFFEAFRSANASLVGTISASFVVPTILISVLFLRETLQVSQIIAISITSLVLSFLRLIWIPFEERKSILIKELSLLL